MSSAVPSEVPIEHRNLPLLLLRAREGTIARFRPLLNAHGITEQQWRVIRALLDSGPLEPRQIGEAALISSPSMAGVLARMDALELVVRERMAHDQRRVIVSLTHKSRTLAAKMAPELAAIYQDLEAHVGNDVMKRLYSTLDELLLQLSDATGFDNT